MILISQINLKLWDSITSIIYDSKTISTNILCLNTTDFYFKVFGLLRQGDGKIIITASFEDKMQTIRLPAIETQESLWEFIEILFEELRCECFYEKGSIKSYSNGNQVPNGRDRSTSLSSPSSFLSPQHSRSF